jgi:hypothetical protein
MDEEERKSSKKEETKTTEGTQTKGPANGKGEAPCDPFVKVTEFKKESMRYFPETA